MDNKYFGSKHVTLIRAGARRGVDLKEIWAYRELLWVLVERDIRVRYKQTALGIAWAVIQPVASMLIFSLFFGRLAKIPSDGYPYSIYVFAALLPWTFFANAITASSNSLIGSSNLVSKIYFPRLIIPLGAVGACLVDFAIAVVLLFIMMAWYGIGWTPNLLMAPFLILGVLFISVGVGALLSALIVAYRDFRYVVPFAVQLWFFCTPVVYPARLIPAKWQWVLFMNPMAGMVDAFRSCFLGKPFDLTAIGLSLLIAAAMFVVGVFYFERVERRFADII